MASKERIMLAVAWAYGKPGRTQVMAADKFGLSQSAISTEKSKQERAIDYCKENGSKVERVGQFLINHPDAIDAGWVAKHTNMDTQDAARILYAFKVNDMRVEAGVNAQHTVIDPLQTAIDRKVGALDMRAKCARLMRAIAGEHGEAMAQAIEALTEV
jgi:hypothetical protein